MFQRSEYAAGELTETSLLSSPIDQLTAWLNDAARTDAREPNAMCVSTVSPEGRPSARMVLLKNLDERGLVFATNYASRKGGELHANPACCATFWWGGLERQVRVEGFVERASAEESDALFKRRSVESQFSSAASPQSQVVEDRDELEAMVEALNLRHPDGEIARPAHWGGYRIVPDRFEFWQGRPARLHDRLVYRKVEGVWHIERLAP